jgi:HAMP domain-containing protein
MLGLFAAMLVAGGVVGGLAARSVMRRIGRVNDLADRVADGALDARLPGARSEDEFGLLETHVHGMLDRIQNLNRATHRLSDTIAHELRTPLNRMLQKLSRIEGQEEITAELKAEMRQAIRMFDSLLDISRAEADQGTGGGLVPVDLSAVCAEVWELYEPLAEDKGLIPDAAIAPGLRVLGDRNLIAQVLSNLLDNAIKYCAAGRPPGADGFRRGRAARGAAGRWRPRPTARNARRRVRAVHAGRTRPGARHSGAWPWAGFGARHRGAARRAADPAAGGARPDGRDRLSPDAAGLGAPAMTNAVTGPAGPLPDLCHAHARLSWRHVHPAFICMPPHLSGASRPRPGPRRRAVLVGVSDYALCWTPTCRGRRPMTRR